MDRKKYIYGIDGLRALAMLMVLGYHLQLPFMQSGFLGVTIFFVISGYLVTRGFLQSKSRGYLNKYYLREFWIKRVKRLLPTIFIVVASVIISSVVLNRVVFTKACNDSLSALLGYNNWWQIFNNVSYFENAGAPSPFTHFWSLAIEIQFYVLYPLLIVVLTKMKNGTRNLGIVTTILTVISIGLMWVMFDPNLDPSRVYYGTDTRMFSLLIGALLAILIDCFPNLSRVTFKVRDILGGISLVGLLYMTIFMNEYSEFYYHGGQALVSIMVALIIYSVLNSQSIIGKVFSYKPLRWLSKRSYAIYLWHYPVIILLGNGKKLSWYMMIVAVVITLLLACLSYHFIEQTVAHGSISKNLKLFKTDIKAKRKVIMVSLLTATMALSSVMCFAFVPREYAVNNIEKFKSEEEKAKEILEKKQAEAKKKEEEIAKQMKSDEELLASLNLLLIGDSVSLGAIDEFYQAFPNSINDSLTSRHCNDSMIVYNEYVNNHGWDGDGFIFALGTNGYMYESLEKTRELLGPDRPMFVLTLHCPTAKWETMDNEKIRSFVAETENTYLIDWYTYSKDHSEYFVSDDTHLTTAGRKPYMDCMKEVVLKVFREKEQEKLKQEQTKKDTKKEK